MVVDSEAMDSAENTGSEERPAVIARLRGLPVDAVCGNRPELLHVLRPA